MIDLQFITFLSLLPLSEEISFVHYQGRNIFRDVIIPTEVLIMMREIFRKKIQTGSFCSFRSSTLKICTFSLSVVAFLKWCLKINVSLCISTHMVLTWNFSMWQGSAEKCNQCCLFYSPSVSITSGSAFLTTIVLVFRRVICVCPGMDHPVSSPSLKQISAPPLPDPGFFTSMCLCLLHLVPGVHSTHSTSWSKAILHFYSVPLPPWSLPSDINLLQAHAEGSLQGWKKTDLCGPMDMGVASQPCYLFTSWGSLVCYWNSMSSFFCI